MARVVVFLFVIFAIVGCQKEQPQSKPPDNLVVPQKGAPGEEPFKINLPDINPNPG